MKKILCFVLCILVCVSSLSVFAAEAEFKPGDEYKDGEGFDTDIVRQETLTSSHPGVYYSDLDDMTHAGILGALKIMGAYSGNEFKPNVYISRLDALEYVLNLIKVDYSVPPASVKGSFYDVPPGSDDYNAVYHAYNMGIVSGYGENTFRPDSVISYEEALSMVIHALGYTKDAVNVMGGYVNGYLKVAKKLGLDDGINVRNTKALTRIELCDILYNALFAPVAEFVKENGDIDISAQGNNVLYQYYNVIFDTGLVTGNSFSDLDGNETQRNSFYVNNVRYKDKNELYGSFMGYKSDYYYEKDKKELVYAVKSCTVKEVKINAEDLESFENGRFAAYSGKTKKSYSVSKTYNLIYNGAVPSQNYNKDIFDIDTGSIVLVSNYGGSVYDTVIVEEYRNEIISRPVLSDNELSIPLDDCGRIELDLDKTYLEVINPDGSTAEIVKYNESGQKKYDISAIIKNSVISLVVPYGGYSSESGTIVPDKDIKYLKMYISDKVATGKVNAIINNGDDFEIEDESGNISTYKISPSNCFENGLMDIETGRTESFYTDYFGQIVGKKDSVSKEWQYGYLIAVDFSNMDGNVQKVKMLTQGGKVEIFNVNKNVVLNGKTVKANLLDDRLSETAQMINTSFVYSQPLKYKLAENNDEKPLITSFETVTQDVGVAPGYTDDHFHRMSYTESFRSDSGNYGMLCEMSNSWKGKYFNPSLVFKVSTVENSDDKKYKVTAISSGITYSSMVMDVYDADDLAPGLVVWYNDDSDDSRINTSFNGNDAPVMFDKTFVGHNDDNETVLKIRVAQMGTVKDYWSYDMNVADGLVCGELIWLYGSNETFEITKIEDVLYNGKKITPQTLPDIETAVHTNDEYYNDFVEAYEILGTRQFILQRGNFFVNPDGTTDGLKRETLMTGYIGSDSWMMGGILVYEHDRKNPVVRNGTIDDIKSVKEYGLGKASKIIARVYAGCARQYVVYNLE